MSLLDGVIVAAYLAGSLALGLALARRGSGSLEDFFVGGRTMPWWLAGTSMAATTFSIDTPLYVAGVVGTRGIAGNWEWWSFAVAHLLLLYLFARMWSRARVITDNELSELRYGGRPAAILRGTKGFLYAVVIGSIGIGLAMLAMVKVIDALQVLPSLGIEAGPSARLWTVMGVGAVVLVYASVAGLWGVVVTDFLQFALGLLGAVVVAWAAVAHVGGLGELVRQAELATDFDLLAFTPLKLEGGSLFWSVTAGISSTTFLAYLFVQWWAFRRSDGGGEFVQRLASVRSEADAERAAWLFNLLHYVIRTWPWVIVALAAVVIYPELEDRELGYPTLMLDFLPTGVLGLVVASLVAAFMSTVSTLINWSASYLTNDVYLRFMRPAAGRAEQVAAGRGASVLVTVLGAVAAFNAADVTTLFRLIIAVGTGPGLVLVLRWFWWRINAWAEMAAMVAGFAIGLTTSLYPELVIDDFGTRLTVTAGLTFVIWFIVLIVTPPESDDTLDAFYRRVRPGGPGWRRQRERTGLEPIQDLKGDLLRSGAGLAALFGTMFFVGGALLMRPGVAAINGAIAIVGVILLRRWRPEQPLV